MKSIQSLSRQHATKTIRNLFSRLKIVEEDHQEEALIKDLLAPRQTTIVSYLNQHAVNLACRDPGFGIALAESDILFRDGVGVEVGLKLLGNKPGKNVNGTDFIPRLIEASRGRTVAVYGTQAPWLERSVGRIKEVGATVVASLDGFQDEGSYIASVEEADPDVILLGMGMPKQEKLAAVLMQRSKRPRLIVNGGAILDFYAGRFRRAPRCIRRLRLEWVFRLAQEPRRLADRYLVGGVQFVWRVCRIALLA